MRFSWSALIWTAAGAVAVRLLRLMQRWRLRKLSGPFALPIFGNLPAIVAMPGGFAMWRNAMFKKYGGLYKVWIGGLPAVVVTDTDLVHKIGKASSKRPSLSRMVGGLGEARSVLHGLLFISPEEHGKKFRSVRRAFEVAVMTPASLQTSEPMMQQCVERLITRLVRSADSGEPVDMRLALADMTLEAIGFAAFGIDLHCQDGYESITAAGAGDDGISKSKEWLSKPGSREFGREVTKVARVVLKVADPAVGSAWKLPAQFIPELEVPLRYLSSWLPDKKMANEIEARLDLNDASRALMKQWEDYKKAQQNKDTSVPLPAMSERSFLANLLNAADAEGLSELDVIAQMLLAGYDTTASTLTTAVYYLQLEPQTQALLQAEVDSVLRGKRPSAEDLEHMPYLRAVIDESLRMMSPADMVIREMQSDMKLADGKVIPAHMGAYLSICSLHRDPAIWPRADEFLPQRWLPGHEDLAPKRPDAFVPWGLGARMCPGYKFALLEARLCLARLAQTYTFSPAPGMPKTKWISGVVFSPDCLWSIVSRRKAQT